MKISWLGICLGILWGTQTWENLGVSLEYLPIDVQWGQTLERQPFLQ